MPARASLQPGRDIQGSLAMRSLAFNLATFAVIGSEWLAGAWFAYRMVKNEHDEAERMVFATKRERHERAITRRHGSLTNL